MDAKLLEALKAYVNLLVEEDRRASQNFERLLAKWRRPLMDFSRGTKERMREESNRVAERARVGEKLLNELRKTMPKAEAVSALEQYPHRGKQSKRQHEHPQDADQPSGSATEISPGQVKSEPSPAPTSLDSFESKLIKIYNEAPDQWRLQFKPESFGAANVNALFKATYSEADFQIREEGIYDLVRDQTRCLVVPHPGLKLQDLYFNLEAVAELFESNFERGSVWERILLIRPALVKQSGDRWSVERIGEIREVRGSQIPGA